MRKLISTMAVLIIIVLGLGPFIVGLWLEKSSYDFVDLHQSDENIRFAILDYHRGWFSSDMMLEVSVNEKYLQKIFADEEIAKKISKVILIQHIQHGPLFYYARDKINNIFGLATIKNKIIISPEMDAYLLLMDMPNVKIESNGFISFFGNYFNHLKIAGFHIRDAVTPVKTAIQTIDTNFWFYPRQDRFKGKIEITNLSVRDEDDTLEIPYMEIQLDQYLDKHNVWLGTGTMNLSEIIFRETGEKDIRVFDLNVEGFSEADNDFLNMGRTIKIKAIQLEDKLFGPIDLQISLNKFNLLAIHDLLTEYVNTIQNGEVYQGQLKGNIERILPKIINAGSSIKVDKLDIAAPSGNIAASGHFEWPEKNAILPSNVPEMIQMGQAKLEIKISKKLMSDLIYYSSHLPDFIRDVAAPQKKLLLDARNEMDFSMKRNSIYIEYLSYNGYISKQAEDALIKDQENLVPMSDYRKTVKDLFLDRQIPLVVSYQLCSQYRQILKPYYFLEDRVVEYQKIAEKQIREKFNGLVKKGYVSENDGEYIAALKWSQDAFTSNGHAIK